jgi:hypothetical protein
VKKAVLFLILALVFVVGCACPSKVPAPKPAPVPTPGPKPSLVSPEFAVKLAEKFAPVIYLKGEGKTIENYEPEQIEIFVNDAVVRDIQNPGFSAKASLAGLLQWSKGIYYLDLANLAPKTQSPADYRLAYEKMEAQYQPTLYVRVREGVDGYTVVQDWLFYFANDWRNFHEGDWELVQLHFPPETPGKLLEDQTLPVFMALSQHQYGQQMPWSDMVAKSLVEGTHPVVYVARGSHANYFLPGNPWAVLDFDDTGLSSWQTIQPAQFKVVLLPDEGEEKTGLDWVDFRGRWGEYLGLSLSVLGMSFMQAGPFGPLWADGEKKSDRWENPVQWASQLPRYPDPFWSAFLKMLPDPSKLAIFSIFSPAELHVYDVQGRYVGPTPTGEVERGIPGAIYVTVEGADYKTVIIPNADVTQEYRIEARGTGTGKMDLRASVPDVKAEVKRFLEYLNVPITPKTTARTSVKPVPLLAVPPAAPEGKVRRPETVRDETTELEIDSDGDGVFELKKTPGEFEKEGDREDRKSEETKPAPSPVTPGLIPVPQPAPAPTVVIKPREVEIMPVSDFYIVQVIAQEKDAYTAEISPKADATFAEPVRVRLNYAPGFVSQKIGDTPLVGAVRPPSTIGEIFEIKGVLRLKEKTLEIISWKQNLYLERAFIRYREALAIMRKTSAQASEASIRYNALFDALAPGKCLYRADFAVPAAPPVPWPPYSGPAPVPVDRLAREVDTGLSTIVGLKASIEGWAEEVGELVVQDCRDDLRAFREDRTSPSNLMTRKTSALDEIEGDISRIKELLERGMAAPQAISLPTSQSARLPPAAMPAESSSPEDPAGLSTILPTTALLPRPAGCRPLPPPGISPRR